MRIALYGYLTSGSLASLNDKGKVEWGFELANPDCIDVTWEELVVLLRDARECPCGAKCVGKNCLEKVSRAWSPVDIHTRRLEKNVSFVTAAVFDFDHLSPDQAREVAQKLVSFKSVWHTTHSHKLESWSLRDVIAVSRPMTPAEWKLVLRAFVVAHGLPADPSCKDASRLYFLPNYPAGAEHWVEVLDGQVLDVDAYLTYAASLPRAPASTMVEPDDSEPEPALDDSNVVTDLGELRQALMKAKRSKTKDEKGKVIKDPDDKPRDACLRRIKKGDALAVPGSFTGKTNLPRGRNTELNRAAWVLAYTLPPGTPAEAAWQLLAPSLAKMDLEEEPEDWEENFAKSYDKATDKRAEDDIEFAKKKADTLRLLSRTRALIEERYGPSRANAKAEDSTLRPNLGTCSSISSMNRPYGTGW